MRCRPEALLLTIVTACSTPGTPGNPPPSEDAPPGRGRVVGNVGNNASGLADQPDWDASAKRIAERMEGRFPTPLPAPEAACNKMLDAARDHYKQTDGEGSDAVKRLAATRSADHATCVRETTPEVAWCVATLVAEDIGEYPFLLDQCERAFGKPPPPTVEAPPSPNKQAKAAPAKSTKADALEMTFVGDVIFGRYRANGYDPIPEDGFEVFGPTADALKSDLLVGNLETPLVRDLPDKSPIGSRFAFGASPEHAQHLVKAGFDVMSLANNHYYDQKVEGLEQSPVLLKEIGIMPIGAARADAPLFRIESTEVEGWKVAFVAVSTRRNAPEREGVPELPFLATRDMEDELSPLMKEAAAAHDLVVVMVHWGNEYADDPDYAQVKAAHALVDAGADLVIGHHPHVLQAIEAYEQGLIAYSLGNFLFENTTEIPRLTGVLRVRWTKDDCYDKAVFHPAYIKRLPVQHPVPADGFMGRKVRDRLISLAKRKGTEWAQVPDSEDVALAAVTCR